MPGRNRKTPTAVELEFLQVLWSKGEATTEDVMSALAEQGRELADGTVRKMLSILIEKGFVSRRKQGRGYVYRPTVGREQASRRLVTDLLERGFGGNAALMVAALIDSRSIRDEDMDAIMSLIAERTGGKRNDHCKSLGSA
jgi:predicted transcriptional regulator